MDMILINIRFQKELIERLKDEAQKRNITFSSFVRLILSEYLSTLNASE